MIKRATCRAKREYRSSRVNRNMMVEPTISSMDIRGCNCEKTGLQGQAWWPTDEMIGTYSSLCFAILDDDKAETIMQELEKNPIAVDKDFPARAFLMNVEKTA